jgi:hypothetical protein
LSSRHTRTRHSKSNTVTGNDREYFIRLVIYVKKQITKNKPRNTITNDIHSTFISEVFIYENTWLPTSTAKSTGEGSAGTFNGDTGKFLFQSAIEGGRGQSDNEGMGEIREKLNSLAVPMETVEYSRNEYNRLFPEGKIKTPEGVVQLSKDQFSKLTRKNRQHLLGAMRQTLAEPVIILSETQDGRAAKLYIKSFTGDKNISFVMSVVIRKGGNNLAISTGPRKKKQIEKKIMTGIPLYISTEGVAAGLIGTGKDNLATQQYTLSSNPSEKSSRSQCQGGGIYFSYLFKRTENREKPQRTRSSRRFI